MITIWDIILWLSGFLAGGGVMFVALVYLGKRLADKKRLEELAPPQFRPMVRTPFPQGHRAHLVEFRKGDHT